MWVKIIREERVHRRQNETRKNEKRVTIVKPTLSSALRPESKKKSKEINRFSDGKMCINDRPI